MHTRPSLYTLGCHISDVNMTVGGGVGVVVAEGHQGLEETTIIERIWLANDRDLPLEDVAVVDQTRAETVHGLLGELCA